MRGAIIALANGLQAIAQPLDTKSCRSLLKKNTMTRRSGRRRRDRELLKALETQNRLHDALKLLFELLETYSPP